ncbi:MAG: 9-O-acetylesterase [Candidatus Symbiothrix sp.]|jgi:sialate O-acetylesterase|nr:9-O-acetylesterase [Candidatus Symbiothrix sp.]
MKNKLFALVVAALCAAPLSAKIVLPDFFSDNMVLQQQTNAPVWGTARPKKTVKITTSWDNQTYSVPADADGKWSVRLKTPNAGGPYSISFSDGNDLKINNVLIGEVWICSGQSNMEMPLEGWGKIDNYLQEIAAADYPNIRLLHVEKATSTQPQSDITIINQSWQVCTPASIANFSAVAYFFGRDLYQNLNIPIGLINTSWGGTLAEAWTSGDALENMPYFHDALKAVRTQDVETIQQYEKKLADWEAGILAADKGWNAWNQAGFNDSDWQTMNIPQLWENAGLPNFDGIVWFRRTIEIPAEWAGKEVVLSLDVIDDNDITYFNGRQTGETNRYDKARIYTVPATLVKKGKAEIAVRVADTGGGGGIYGNANNIYMALKSKEEETKTSLAGEWKFQVSVNAADLAPAPVSPASPHRPSVLYNAMIHPLVPYAMRGAIWYQGESNADRAEQYKELMPLLIRDWRKAWNNDFPFYLVQLANYRKRNAEPVESDWAELREAQLQTLYLDNTGMAVTIDIGDAADIHPKNKQDVGKRLALAARANTYKQNIEFSGPLYQCYTIESDRIRIYFSHADGLKTADNQALTGFSIAGPDHQFHWADAHIDGNTIVVCSPKVAFPVAVRYAWSDNPVCNLQNDAGLPASPFRTDDWK